jgi:hypothetical protein
MCREVWYAFADVSKQPDAFIMAQHETHPFKLNFIRVFVCSAFVLIPCQLCVHLGIFTSADVVINFIKDR